MSGGGKENELSSGQTSHLHVYKKDLFELLSVNYNLYCKTL